VSSIAGFIRRSPRLLGAFMNDLTQAFHQFGVICQ
jgi:hypothetical protein